MFIICSFCFIGILLGVILTKKFKYQFSYYKEISEFILYYKNSITFAQLPLIEIIDNFCKNKKKTYFPFCLFKEYFSGKKIVKNIQINEKYLTKDENEEILQIIANLGTLGLSEEIEKANAWYKMLCDRSAQKKITYEKYASLFIKLGATIGLILGIILA